MLASDPPTRRQHGASIGRILDRPDRPRCRGRREEASADARARGPRSDQPPCAERPGRRGPRLGAHLEEVCVMKKILITFATLAVSAGTALAGAGSAQANDGPDALCLDGWIWSACVSGPDWTPWNPGHGFYGCLSPREAFVEVARAAPDSPAVRSRRIPIPGRDAEEHDENIHRGRLVRAAGG